MPCAITWTPQMEIELFHAIMSHKPVGIDRHFQMICIKSLLQSHPHTRHLTIQQLWEKLDTLYNMEELHESEVDPFSSKLKEFTLPEEYATLKAQPFPRAQRDPGKSDRSNTLGQKRTRKSLRSNDSRSPPRTRHPSSPVKSEESTEPTPRRHRRT